MESMFDIFKFLFTNNDGNNNLINLYKKLLDYQQTDKLDLSKKEDIDKAHKMIEKCKNDKLSKEILDMLNIDLSDLEKTIDNIFDIYKKNNKVDKKENKVSCIDRKEVDNSIEIPIKDTEESNSKSCNKSQDSKLYLDLPSKTLPTNVGLQIHKLTQEYVDKYIKPYKSDIFTTEKINNVYSALYEFAAWIYQK